MITSLMATKKFGVRFWEKGHPSRNERSLFNYGVLRPPVASIVSPDIPYNQAPCEISFFPPDVELVECPDLGIPGKSESLTEEIERTSTWKAEALFRIRLSRPLEETVKSFEKELRRIRKALKENKRNLLEKPLFGNRTFQLSRKVRIETFRKYLRWYDLYMGLLNVPGISFRGVALLDNMFQTKTVNDILADLTNQPGFVFDELGTGGNKIPERNVTKSIQMIYKFIYREDIKTLPGRKKDTKKPEALFKKRIPLDSFERETIRPGRHIKKKSTSWPDSPSE